MSHLCVALGLSFGATYASYSVQKMAMLGAMVGQFYFVILATVVLGKSIQSRRKAEHQAPYLPLDVKK